MGKIVISENVSLDGVVQDPTGEEGFRRGGWVGQVGQFKDREEAAKVLLDEALGTEAMLLGRRTYEFFAARWPSRTGAWRGWYGPSASCRDTSCSSTSTSPGSARRWTPPTSTST